jgi:hypothetical protein
MPNVVFAALEQSDVCSPFAIPNQALIEITISEPGGDEFVVIKDHTKARNKLLVLASNNIVRTGTFSDVRRYCLAGLEKGWAKIRLHHHADRVLFSMKCPRAAGCINPACGRESSAD